jgi:hypothetical protein
VGAIPVYTAEPATELQVREGVDDAIALLSLQTPDTLISGEHREKHNLYHPRYFTTPHGPQRAKCCHIAHLPFFFGTFDFFSVPPAMAAVNDGVSARMASFCASDPSRYAPSASVAVKPWRKVHGGFVRLHS